ncbi:MAG: hypothetical protein GQF41_3930 [Candidatus Rifleibacterium amylolyticum]|nr:MAG: hypothetical protein GQF41_3930 [Candidatus Rifleibacterium amylolyticum]
MNLLDENKIHKIIDELSTDYLSFLQELIRCPSPLTDVESCMSLVYNRMQKLELSPTQYRYTDKDSGFVFPSLVGHLPGSGEFTFVLNAHIDTAPVESPDTWLHHPYSATISENRLYGRGAVDDKAGVAMLLLLADTFRRLAEPLPSTLLFECVSGDECCGFGSLSCLNAGLTCDAAIVIDGTWPYRIIDAHLGQIWVDVCFRGVAAAACSQNRVQSPIQAAFELNKQLQKQCEIWSIQTPDWEGLTNPYFTNLGKISAGAWAGATPEVCECSFQIGFAPPITYQAAFNIFLEKAENIARSFNLKYELKKNLLALNSFSNRNNNLVQLVKSVIPITIGNKMPPLNVAVMGHCDLRFFQRKDGSPADACLYGPGGGYNPHAVDESYEIDHFVPVAKTIASAIIRWNRGAK